MIKTFKEKAPQVQAVEYTGISSQLTEVADLVKAESFNVDLAKQQATFTVGEHTYTAKQGQVVAVTGESVNVFDADDFYAKYEAL